VEGHVEASTEAEGCDTLSRNGVVTESLVPDPKPLNLNDELPKAPEFADALESAFDSSSSQVDFDALTERYQGKKVWVIDRDKIRRRVAQVIDAALALSALHGEGHDRTRARINSALEGMFSDNRNLATERNADSLPGVRFNGGSPPPPFPQPPSPVVPASARLSPYLPGSNGGTNGSANGGGFASSPYSLVGHPGLESQLGRLTSLVKQAEAALAAVSAAARRGGSGGGGGPRRASVARGGKGEEQNTVLLEIFKSNLELVRTMEDPLSRAPADGALESAPVGGVAETPHLSMDSAGDEHAVEPIAQEPSAAQTLTDDTPQLQHAE
jgi:hypothetical protein